MIDKQLDEVDTKLSIFEQCIACCDAELNCITERLNEVRRRQKAQFGDMLLRITLNRPLTELLDTDDNAQ